MRSAKPKGKARSTPKRAAEEPKRTQPAKSRPAVPEAVGVKTRQRAIAEAKKPRLQGASQNARSSTSVQCLPPEVIQVIGSKLDKTSLMSSRLVCKLWGENVAAGVTHLSTYMHHDKDETIKKVKKIRALMPSLNSMNVYISSRLHQAVGNKFLEALRTTPRLQHLNFTSHHVPDPRWPILMPFGSFKGLSQFTKLRSLSFSNLNLPTGMELQSLSTLTALTKLSFPSLPDRDPTNPLGMHTPATVRPEQLSAICGLTSLQHLELNVADYGELQQLTRLQQLTCLVSARTIHRTAEDWRGLWAQHANLQVLDVPVGSTCVDMGVPIEGVERFSSVSLTLHIHGVPWPKPEVDYCIKHSVKLQKLVLKGVFAAMSDADSNSLRELTSLQHLEVYGVCAYVRLSGILTVSASLKKLTTLVCARPLTGTPLDEPELEVAVARLSTTHGDLLQRFELEGVISSDLGSSVTCLQSCTALHTLSIKCANSSPWLQPIPVARLPPALRVLKLRFAQLQGVAKHQQVLSGLQELQLISCTVESTKHLPGFLSSLTGLRSLQLDSLSQLKDRHIASLAGLTQLTSLSVMAVTNPDVTNAGLGAVTTLTKLHTLAWHVGDMLDMTPDVSFFQHFKKLQLLSITTSMFYRLSRWSALGMMEFLPQCQMETVGA